MAQINSAMNNTLLARAGHKALSLQAVVVLKVKSWRAQLVVHEALICSFLKCIIKNISGVHKMLHLSRPRGAHHVKFFSKKKKKKALQLLNVSIKRSV